MSRGGFLLAALLAVLAAPVARAQDWPARPVRVIVNVPPGGGIDQITRAFAPRLGEALGQPVVVENRSGAGGNIGVEAVARAAADGYTLLSAIGSTIVIGPPRPTRRHSRNRASTSTRARCTVCTRRPARRARSLRGSTASSRASWRARPCARW